MIPHMLGCTLVVSLAVAFTPAAQANTNPREQLAPRQHHGDWVNKLRNTPINKEPGDQEYKEGGKPGDPIIRRMAPYGIDLAQVDPYQCACTFGELTKYA